MWDLPAWGRAEPWFGMNSHQPGELERDIFKEGLVVKEGLGH